MISDFKFKKFLRNPFILFANNYIGPPSTLIYRKEILELYDKRFKWIVDREFYICLARKYRLLYIGLPLVSISYNDTQITNYVKRNPSVETPEAMIFYTIYGDSMLFTPVVYDGWWRVLRNLKIKSIDQFMRYFANEQPVFIHTIIIFNLIFILVY